MDWSIYRIRRTYMGKKVNFLAEYRGFESYEYCLTTEGVTYESGTVHKGCSPFWFMGKQGGYPAKRVIRGMEGLLRISSSNVGMESARAYTASTEYSMFFSVTNSKIAANDAENKKTETNKNFTDLLDKGEESQTDSDVSDSLLSLNQSFRSISQVTATSGRSVSNTIQKIKIHTLMFLLDLLVGTSKKASSLNELLGLDEDENDMEALFQEAGQTQMYGTSATMQSFSFKEHIAYAESESTSFHTKGTVVTADGREIEFGVDMEMSRSFAEQYDVELIQQNVSFCDPLVINLDGDTAEVSDQKFLFDIDSDGVRDSISKLASGSGYLALDLNEDGVINDGSELFGTKSGNGFKDLAKYDSDGDGWIDEDDEVWSKLLIWSKDEKGNDTLYHLDEKGIGAISLQNTATDFSLNSQETNQVNARIRNTGIFLYENGNVGTVQHLDLAK